MLNKINPKPDGQDYYFQNKKETGTVKEMTETISYSMAFIFTFFMGGLTGYYVGAFFLGWSMTHSLILALIFMVGTLVLETTLFIIKQTKKQRQMKGGGTNNPISSHKASQVVGDSFRKRKDE